MPSPSSKRVLGVGALALLAVTAGRESGALDAHFGPTTIRGTTTSKFTQPTGSAEPPTAFSLGFLPPGTDPSRSSARRLVPHQLDVRVVLPTLEFDGFDWTPLRKVFRFSGWTCLGAMERTVGPDGSVSFRAVDSDEGEGYGAGWQFAGTMTAEGVYSRRAIREAVYEYVEETMRRDIRKQWFR